MDSIPQNRRHRLLIICSHPVQYASPLFRQMARNPRLQLEVAYCGLQGAQAGFDPDFGQDVKWDVPLLEGYSWTEVPNRAPNPGFDRFFGLINTRVWTMVRKGGYDAVIIHTGYRCATFWITMAASKLSGIPILFGTDAGSLRPRDGASWKESFKRYFWPLLFGLADQAIVPSSGSYTLMRSLGLPDDKITLTPFVVDNDWWMEHSALVDRDAVRALWRVPVDATVAVFCAKLQPWKRPLDLLRAFAKVQSDKLFLIFAGDGSLKSELESEAATLGVSDRVRMLGFVNQSQLPSVYTASDILVLPSDYEPFGLVVNEAMLCGCTAVVSDRVGAGPDLIQSGQNGFVFPYGDIDALAKVLSDIANNPARLSALRAAAILRMQTWSPREHTSALICALDRVVPDSATADSGQ